MLRALFSIGKTYLTVKLVELVADAFRKPKPRQPARRAASRQRPRRTGAAA